MVRLAYIWGAILVVLTPLALYVDKWAITHLGVRELPGDLVKAVMLAEAFAHTISVSVILVGIWFLDPRASRKFPLLLAASFGTGVPVHLLKRLIGRLRPSAWDFEGSILHSFLGLFPWRERGLDALRDASIQSFPSAHTALACGFAWALAYCYPRARWYFAALAAAAGLQRVVAHAHYPSDVLFGAAIGCFVFACCADRRVLGRWLLPDPSACGRH